MMSESLPDADWATFRRHGYVRLGPVLDSCELDNLRRRIDEIMLGTAEVPYERMRLQLDSTTGRYEDMPAQTFGHKGATLAYRKIQQLEFDPVFLTYMQKPLLHDICGRQYGQGIPVSVYRAMFMNKPAGRGTRLPWHQDNFPDVSHRPVLTVWLALDDANESNGCVRALLGSHLHFRDDDDTVFLDDTEISEVTDRYETVSLPCPAGEAILLHNRLLHTSGVNATDEPRRAFSVCYMDGRSGSDRGETFSTVFGDGSLTPREVGPAMVG